ncbi:hypothetical protein [Burkholderia plantarii]|uniref:hypothetical protein n=1 Tax=Burkholderia plantarii TaxID=41899 RepID=UPI000F5104CB|nr:hypothetical protein [Burkholderia plantarii]WLE61933.1 hypothetical protein GIY62_31445 [Burkholderia plantarii]
MDFCSFGRRRSRRIIVMNARARTAIALKIGLAQYTARLALPGWRGGQATAFYRRYPDTRNRIAFENGEIPRRNRLGGDRWIACDGRAEFGAGRVHALKPSAHAFREAE